LGLKGISRGLNLRNDNWHEVGFRDIFCLSRYNFTIDYGLRFRFMYLGLR
jgi:hypothetical protein